ncbi:hypothetical protein ABT040_35575 [Streptomyces sp. NPDC002688]|uniref:VMAP-C domain-containing protein n=1 Tax=Streptomyces sp. NPDC002688 TaxID=3154423 RepID=UPI00331853DE
MKRAQAAVPGDDGRREPREWNLEDVERLCDALAAFPDVDDPRFVTQLGYLMRKRLGGGSARFAVPNHADARGRIIALVAAIDGAQDREKVLRALAYNLRLLYPHEAAVMELDEVVAELAPETRLSGTRLQAIAEYLDTVRGTLPLVVAHDALRRVLLPEESSSLRGTEAPSAMVRRLNDAKESETAQPLVLRFLAELAASVSKDVADVLRSHVLLAAHELGLAPETRAALISRPHAVPARATRRVLQIQLSESAPGTQEYTLDAVLFDWTDQGPRRPLRKESGRLYPLRELQQCGRTCLVEWEDLVIGLDLADHAHVEFVLPWSLLAHPVERWLTDAQGYLLGHKYPVVVRSLDRIRQRSWHRDWRHRWTVLRDTGLACGPEDLVSWLALAPASDLEEHGDVLYLRGRDGEVRAWLDQHAGSAGLALAFAYDHRDARCALALQEAVCEGVPFMVWRRDDGDPAELAVRLNESAQERFADLPDRLRQWRRGASRDDETDMHNHLTLFWDNPDCVYWEGQLNGPGTDGAHAVSPFVGPKTREAQA